MIKPNISKLPKIPEAPPCGKTLPIGKTSMRKINGTVGSINIIPGIPAMNPSISLPRTLDTYEPNNIVAYANMPKRSATITPTIILLITNVTPAINFIILAHIP